MNAYHSHTVKPGVPQQNNIIFPFVDESPTPAGGMMLVCQNGGGVRSSNRALTILARHGRG